MLSYPNLFPIGFLHFLILLQPRVQPQFLPPYLQLQVQYAVSRDLLQVTVTTAKKPAPCTSTLQTLSPQAQHHVDTGPCT